MRVRPCGGRRGSLAWVGEGAHGRRRLAALREPSGVARGHNYRWSRVVRPDVPCAADVSSAPCSVLRTLVVHARGGARAHDQHHGSTFLPPISKGNRAR